MKNQSYSNQKRLKVMEECVAKLSQEIEQLRGFESSKGWSWIRNLRTMLGMSMKDLERQAGMSQGSIAQAERREAEGSLSLTTLKKAADAMNCELKYVFVPRSDMNSFVDKKAYEKAKRITEKANLHMSLENQSVPLELKESIDLLAAELKLRGKVW